MTKFKDGDRIQVIKKGKYNNCNYEIGDLGTFVKQYADPNSRLQINVHLDKGGKTYLYETQPNLEIELYKEKASRYPFKIGDKIKCINVDGIGTLDPIALDEEYVVEGVYVNGVLLEDKNGGGNWSFKYFELVESYEPGVTKNEGWGF